MIAENPAISRRMSTSRISTLRESTRIKGWIQDLGIREQSIAGLRRSLLALVGLIVVVSIACTSADDFAPSVLTTESLVPEAVASFEVPVPTPTVPSPPTLTPIPTSSRDSVPSEAVAPFTGEWTYPEAERVFHWAFSQNWDTDFRFRTIDLAEIETYNFRDRISPLDSPEFTQVGGAPDYMKPGEPVVSLVVDGRARAYPLAILMRHEVVNDSLGDRPVVVTYCPLCNTAIVFESTVDGQQLRFGTTGNLRKSDLIMWDSETSSWWQQITGEAIVGEYAQSHTVLETIPTEIIPWERFANDHPEGEVIVRPIDDDGEPQHEYDSPPYTGYVDANRNPLGYNGLVDRQLLVTSRVLALNNDESAVVYPFEFLAEHPVLNDTIDGQSIVTVFDHATDSSFDGYDGEEADGGSATAFSRVVGDRTLSFESDPQGMVDSETGTIWSLSGRGLSGELAGEQLALVDHGNHFWFAVALFWPRTEIRDSLGELAVAAR